MVGKTPTLPEGIQFASEGHVGTITLNRPARLNALTFDIYRALDALFASFQRRRDLRAIILTGEGRGFCSGGDLDEIVDPLTKMNKAEQERFARLTCDLVAKMRACPQPIVAALNGVAAGAGAALAIASDFRIAAPDAKISFLFVRAGLSGADMGASLLLPRLVGLGRASELLMLGDPITAEEAQRIGLYNRVVPRDALAAEARALATRLAEGPVDAMPVTKWSLDRELSMTLAQALEYEGNIQAELMAHPDFREAFEAFREKRKPRFGAKR